MSPDSFRALIADDEAIIRKTVAFALSQEHFVCESAENGEEALSKLSETDFDLLVTDLRMPKMHGHSLATELLDRPSAPIIVVHSSVDNPRLIKDLMARGVDDVVCKPTDYRWFAAKVKGLAVRRRFQKQQRGDGQEDLLKLSHAAIDVLMMATLEQSTIESVSKNIQYDPVLAKELLRIANSLACNPGHRQITSLQEAVGRIGTTRICQFITDQLSGLTESTVGHPRRQLADRPG